MQAVARMASTARCSAPASSVWGGSCQRRSCGARSASPARSAPGHSPQPPQQMQSACCCPPKLLRAMPRCVPRCRCRPARRASAPLPRRQRRPARRGRQQGCTGWRRRRGRWGQLARRGALPPLSRRARRAWPRPQQRRSSPGQPSGRQTALRRASYAASRPPPRGLLRSSSPAAGSRRWSPGRSRPTVSTLRATSCARRCRWRPPCWRGQQRWRRPCAARTGECRAAPWTVRWASAAGLSSRAGERAAPPGSLPAGTGREGGSQ